MDTRREFIKKAGMLAGASGMWSVLPPSLKKAMEINPEPGSTFYDAEHIVFLMQENRSFDHSLGHLQGVRGYNDPRAVDLPDKNKVWLQTNEKGETYAPFRLDLRGTKATWMGSLHHNWWDQVDARNAGLHDKWLFAKKSPHKEFEEMPLTMGYYNREDLPFYYAFADAFTVCDQHFCSCLTGTTANRSYFWSGTIREPGTDLPARVRNSDIGYSKEVDWKTFPERLEDHGISWKVYQNELSIDTVLDGDEAGLLANFTNNNLEWFSQYKVRFSKGHQEYLRHEETKWAERVEDLKKKMKSDPQNEMLEKEWTEAVRKSEHFGRERERWSPENFAKLDPRIRSIHQKAFTDNSDDPDYHRIEEVNYKGADGEEKTYKVPKGDIFHQFRKDVKNGELPAVSWLVAPRDFSDHPTSAWFGAWYVSEVLDILTEDPEVWKKTVFILNYDENDGYFDHVPPFTAPNPADVQTGKTSAGIDSADEFVTLEEEMAKPGMSRENARESATGLGYRVPLIIASPWSRGGWVNSEICDITSTLKFLETFLNHKFNLNLKEENLNSWRRTICGDLTSAFRPYHGEEIEFPEKLDRNVFMEGILAARDKDLPRGYHAMSEEEIRQFNENPQNSPYMPRQEKGIKDANALFYELIVEERSRKEYGIFSLVFGAGDEIFGEKSNGAAFHVFTPSVYRQHNMENEEVVKAGKAWAFAAEAGHRVDYDWYSEDFKDGVYHLRVHGVNGFYREYRGGAGQKLRVNTRYRIEGKDRNTSLVVVLENDDAVSPMNCVIHDRIYRDETRRVSVGPGEKKELVFEVDSSYRWYDLTVEAEGNPEYVRKLAGKIENGLPGKTDPLMGGVV